MQDTDSSSGSDNAIIGNSQETAHRLKRRQQHNNLCERCMRKIRRFLYHWTVRQFPFTNGRADSYLFFQLFLSIWIAIAAGAVWCFSLIIPALSRVGPSAQVNMNSSHHTRGSTTSTLSPASISSASSSPFDFSAEDIAIVSTVGVIMSYCSLPTG